MADVGAPAAATSPPAVRAFDATADAFDRRFGEWLSVAAQRRSVRRHLLAAFPAGARLLELGGGTGEDALFLARHGYDVLFTDGSERMVARAREKARAEGLDGRVRASVAVLEDLEGFALDLRARGEPLLDGVYSNFAALNCVADLRPVARALAALLRPGGRAVLVLFGPLPPGEVLVQLLRGDPAAAVRRLGDGAAPARLGGVPFQVWYPGPRRVRRAFGPEFRAVRTRGVGVFVPPSAAEPWISRHPWAVGVLERLDRLAEAPLAWLGDHVVLDFERTEAPAPELRPARGSGAGGRDTEALRRFRRAYGAHRKAEGRGAGGDAEALALPYVRTGPQAAQWAVRSRTFDRFVSAVLEPCARAASPRPLHVLDLGAGNGWLARRVMQAGHRATALDVRTDAVDGLGAAAAFRGRPPGVPGRVAGSFEALPVASGVADLAVFNASLHYALDLGAALREAARAVAPGGRIVVLDSPFYAAAADGEAMVAEKRRDAGRRFGDRAADLMAPPFVEFLTRDRLAAASASLGLRWRRHRVRYPLRYELRGPLARLRGRRAPSRFDVWETVVP